MLPVGDHGGGMELIALGTEHVGRRWVGVDISHGGNVVGCFKRRCEDIVTW